MNIFFPIKTKHREPSSRKKNSKKELKWKTGDRVGVYLDLEEDFVFYFVNGSPSPDGIAFQNIPKGKYHFYFSCANEDIVEIVDSNLNISQESELYNELKNKMGQLDLQKKGGDEKGSKNKQNCLIF